MVQSVKWVMALTFLRDIMGPSKVAIPYAVRPTTKNLRAALSRTRSHAPRRVRKPLIIPPQEGAMSMIEKVVPRACAHPGNAW